jgi:uncharacterized protein (DUF1015 family)
MELLRTTRAHFGQIFMLYSDPAGEIDLVLDAVSQGPPSAAVTDEYQAVHRLWKISDPKQVELIRQGMSDKKLLIADGHHRYETALAFRDENPQPDDAGRVMMTFVNMHSPGLRILATHRLVEHADPERFLALARAAFRVREIGSPAELRRAWSEPHLETTRIGIAAEGAIYLLEAAKQRGDLDLAFLHERILRDLLGIGEEDVRSERNLRYIRGMEAAIADVRRGTASLAFLLEPTSIEDVTRIALGGGVMPQKSTDFYPKLLSGLTIYKLEK